MQPLFEQYFSAISDPGCVRENNEDYTAFYIPSDAKELKTSGSLFIVADGVGGAARGEVASRYASDTVIYDYFNDATLPPAERLVRSIKKANRDIYMHTQENGNFTRMATTMVAALVLNNTLIVAHVGDSRLYLIREGKMKQMTRDHSVVAEMVRNGTMTEAEARTSKAKNRITRSIGGEADVHVDVSEPVPLRLGDRILLCSDGLTRYMEGKELLTSASASDVETAARQMVETANQRGGADNTSVILVEMVEKAPARQAPQAQPQAPPEKLGWDEMETQYPPQPAEDKRSIPLWLKLSAGGLALLAVAGASWLLLNRNQKEPGLVEVTDTPVETPVEAITATIEANGLGLAPLVQGSDLSEEMGPVLPEETVDTPTPEVVQVLAAPGWECLYQIEPKDGIDDIMMKFGSPYRYAPNKILYYKKDNCLVSEAEGKSIQCSAQALSYPSVIIQPGEWLVVFASDGGEENFSQDQCKQRGGFIYLLETTGGSDNGN